MSKNNAAAWEKLRADGFVVDAQIIATDDDYDKSATAYVGLVDRNDKSRTLKIGTYTQKDFRSGKEAQRDAYVVARAVSRETGIPLRHNVPAERQKQVSSRTIGRAQLKVMHEMKQRQIDDAFEESPQGKLLFWITSVILVVVCTGAWILAAWLMSI